MNSIQFVNKAKDVLKHKTIYIMGCFGAPLVNKQVKQRYIDAYKYNQGATRKKKILEAASDVYGFDCVGLIKAILWGWDGNVKEPYGGSKYASNGVPDIGADAMIKKCKDISTDFKKIIPGEVVWKTGHIGIYIGDGLVIESSPAWTDGVQVTCIGTKKGYNSRVWTKHGKLPYVSYKAETPAPQQPKTYRKGQEVILDKTPVYYASGDKKPTAQLTGRFYIYDGVCVNGKYRITMKAAWCGRKPIAKYVTAWIGG